MALPVRGASSLADEVMEAIAGDIGVDVTPVGLSGLAGTSSQAQVADSPAGRRTPRTPTALAEGEF